MTLRGGVPGWEVEPAFGPVPKDSGVELIEAGRVRPVPMSLTRTQIAIVDDDASFSRALGRMLRASGFDTVVFPDAESFIAGSFGIPMDCVILDVQMSGMSGLQLRQWMLDAGCSKPVIFVTAHDEVEIRRGAAAAGCSAYFRKPVRGEALIAAIRGVVAGPLVAGQSMGLGDCSPSKEAGNGT